MTTKAPSSRRSGKRPRGIVNFIIALIVISGLGIAGMLFIGTRQPVDLVDQSDTPGEPPVPPVTPPVQEPPVPTPVAPPVEVVTTPTTPVEPPTPPAPEPEPTVRTEPEPPPLPAPEPLIQNPVELETFKKDVLDRIDGMDSSKYSEDAKDFARESVQNLKSLRKLATITFVRETKLENAGAEEMLKLILDTSAINEALANGKKSGFIILGFADPSGPPAGNAILAEKRAEYVKSMVMRQRPDVERVIALGLGPTTILNPAETKKNRAAEVWIAIEK